jgi:hypothetical protein
MFKNEDELNKFIYECISLIRVDKENSWQIDKERTFNRAKTKGYIEMSALDEFESYYKSHCGIGSGPLVGVVDQLYKLAMKAIKELQEQLRRINEDNTQEQ